MTRIVILWFLFACVHSLITVIYGYSINIKERERAVNSGSNLDENVDTDLRDKQRILPSVKQTLEKRPTKIPKNDGDAVIVPSDDSNGVQSHSRAELDTIGNREKLSERGSDENGNVNINPRIQSGDLNIISRTKLLEEKLSDFEAKSTVNNGRDDESEDKPQKRQSSNVNNVPQRYYPPKARLDEMQFSGFAGRDVKEVEETHYWRNIGIVAAIICLVMVIIAIICYVKGYFPTKRWKSTTPSEKPIGHSDV